MRHAPGAGLWLMLGELFTLPPRRVMAALTVGDRAWLAGQFSRMRSGHGFCNDLRATPDVTAQVRQPALVVAARSDGGVPFAHAQSLTAAIPHARLIESQADTHFIWLGPDRPAIAQQIRDFLAAGPARQG